MELLVAELSWPDRAMWGRLLGKRVEQAAARWRQQLLQASQRMTLRDEMRWTIWKSCDVVVFASLDCAVRLRLAAATVERGMMRVQARGRMTTRACNDRGAAVFAAVRGRVAVA